MYFIVKISNSQPTAKLCIPSQWVHNLNVSRLLNYGINQKKQYLMYYSPDDKNEPNFRLNQRVCHNEMEYCFYGHIVKSYGKRKIYNICSAHPI